MDAPHDIGALRARLAARGDLALAVVFGSVARGEARPESDLDVAIQPAAQFSAVDEARLVEALARATGREVDLVRLDRVEDVVLRREIARGLPIREAVPGEFARFAADAMLVWLDLAPAYLDAQARYLAHVAAGGR